MKIVWSLAFICTLAPAKERCVSSITSYNAQINKFVRTTPEEEIELVKRIQQGDSVARNRLVEGNLGLVVFLAKERRHRGLSFEDLIGEGNLGLIHAAELYDPAKGSFSHYAGLWIKESIRNALYRNTLVRLPHWAVKMIYTYTKMKQKMKGELSRDPTYPEVMERLGKTKRQQKSFAEVLTSKERRYGTLDLIEIEEVSEEPLWLAEVQEEFAARMALLDEREQKILELHYLEGQSAAKIGKALGFSHEWVRQIRNRALAKVSGER